jgi:hypothetical protein
MTTSAALAQETLVRLANSLEHSVLPYVENHYAQLQVRATREMLLNLSARVRWQDNTEEVLQTCLATLASLGFSAGPGPSDSLVVLRAKLAEAMPGLYEAQRDEEQRQLALKAVWSVVRGEFDAEALRIKTGMYA